MRLKGKVALITGGNSGIGLATAKLFIEEGATVAIVGRNQTTLDEAARGLGPNAIAIKADLVDPNQVTVAVEQAVAKLGKLDILFANAGIPGMTPLGSTEAEAFENILRINVTGVFLTVQAASAHLIDGGSVILNSSVHTVLGIPGYSAYAASKGAISSMSRVLASELAPRKIRVNVVSPGAIQTPIWASRTQTPEATEGLENWVKSTTPLETFGKAIEIANAVLFFASDESKHVTATELFIDGGLTGAPAGAPIYKR